MVCTQKLNFKNRHNPFHDERKVVFLLWYTLLCCGSIPHTKAMKDKIIGAILAGDRIISVRSEKGTLIPVYLSSFKLKPNSTRLQKERQAEAHAEQIIEIVNR